MNLRFIYTGIRVKDMEESIRFYTEILGMAIVDRLESFDPTKGKTVTLKSPNSGQLLELNWYENRSPFFSPYVNGEELDHLAFDVEDLAATVAQLKKEDIEIVAEPRSIGGWKEAFAKDPNGIWIELLERKNR
jgi:lactoylglutathione lyase